MSATVHPAQVNIARMNAPLESPGMAAFAARLDEVTAQADASPGAIATSAVGCPFLKGRTSLEDQSSGSATAMQFRPAALARYMAESASRRKVLSRRRWLPPGARCSR